MFVETSPWKCRVQEFPRSASSCAFHGLSSEITHISVLLQFWSFAPIIFLLMGLAPLSVSFCLQTNIYSESHNQRGLGSSLNSRLWQRVRRAKGALLQSGSGHQLGPAVSNRRFLFGVAIASLLSSTWLKCCHCQRTSQSAGIQFLFSYQGC